MIRTLRLVRTLDEIKRNIRVFNTSAKSHLERARSILCQTTYWVYDTEADQFGPSKFIGFSDMNFAAYEDGLQRRTNGARFDGNLTRTAIEEVIGGPYRPYSTLSNRLQLWVSQLLGAEIFTESDKNKWRFLSLAKFSSNWAVVVNPKFYRIADVLLNETEDTWTVNDSDVRAGDRLALWKAKAGETSRGIIAFAEVLSDPSVMEVPATHRSYCIDPDLLQPRPRVKIRYVHSSNLPLWLGEPGNEKLEALSVARARGGTVFKITEPQWKSIMTLAGGWHPREVMSERDVLFAAAEVLGTKRGGQGFVVDSRMRKAVEDHAVSMAKAHFIAEGYDIEIKGKPYDLCCRKANQILYVEVKGTRTDGDEILLTANEVDFANENSSQMALFIVRRITVSEESGEPIASGGDPEVKRPWKPIPEKLTPLCYSYQMEPEKKKAKAEFAYIGVRT